MINFIRSSPSTPDLGWLIQSREVSDEAFCEALLLGWESQIERLALPFLETPALAGDAVDQVICRAILERGRYRSHTSGAAWLDALVVEECLRRRPSPGPFARRAAESFQPGEAAAAHDTQLFNELGSKNRLLLFLRHDRGLTQAEIAALLKLPLDSVQAGFHALRQSLAAHQRACPQCAAREEEPSGWEADLGRAAVRPLPEPEMRPADTAAGKALLAQRKAAILEQAGRLRRQRQRQSRLRQAAAAALFVIALLALGRFAPLLPPETRPLPVAQAGPTAGSTAANANPPSRDSTSDNGRATANRSRPSAAESPSPRTSASSTADRLPSPPPESLPPLTEILQLARDGQRRWQTLWADVYVSQVDARSPGAPAPAARKQVWLIRSSSSRVISGPDGGDPSETYISENGVASGQNFNSGQKFERPAPDLLDDPDLRTLFAPGDIFRRAASFRLRGSDQVAFRPAWVLDWTPRGSRASRLWIDAKTGVILRLQEYDWPNPQQLVADVRVDSIAYDPPFSLTLFMPDGYRGDHFAHDFTGMPEIEAPQPPYNSGLAPDRSIPDSLDLASLLRYQAAMADILAGLKPPGSKSGSPGGSGLLSCQRSPDGSWLAFFRTRPSTLPAGLYVALSALTGSSLNQPAHPGPSSAAASSSAAGSTTAAGSPTAAGSTTAAAASSSGAAAGMYGALTRTSGDYAFSPDSRRLAFFGCERGDGFCGVSVLDLTTGFRTRLLATSYADYLLWSPDGRSLALVSKQDTAARMAKVSGKNVLLSEIYTLSENWHFSILDAASGEITYERPFHWSQFAAPPDSPTQEWNTPYPGLVRTGEGCS